MRLRHATSVSQATLPIILDEADAATTFQYCPSDGVKPLSLQRQPQIFFQIMVGNVISAHGLGYKFAVVHQYSLGPFDEISEPVGVKSHPREQSMKSDHDKAASDCGQEIRRSVDRSRQHRRQDHEEDAVKNCSPSKRSARAHPNHYQRENKYDHSADCDLGEGERFWLSAKAEKNADRIPIVLP